MPRDKAIAEAGVAVDYYVGNASADPCEVPNMKGLFNSSPLAKHTSAKGFVLVEPLEAPPLDGYAILHMAVAGHPKDFLGQIVVLSRQVHAS